MRNTARFTLVYTTRGRSNNSRSISYGKESLGYIFRAWMFCQDPLDHIRQIRTYAVGDKRLTLAAPTPEWVLKAFFLAKEIWPQHKRQAAFFVCSIHT